MREKKTIQESLINKRVLGLAESVFEMVGWLPACFTGMDGYYLHVGQEEVSFLPN